MLDLGFMVLKKLEIKLYCEEETDNPNLKTEEGSTIFEVNLC